VSAPAVNDSVAAVVKLVVEQEFGTEKFFSAKSEQREHILKDGPGVGSSKG
jgi:hypothetical protein